MSFSLLSVPAIRYCACLMLLVAVSTTPRVLAQNFIKNGEFQTGKLAPWATVGESSMLGYRIDRGFWWLNRKDAPLRLTGLTQRLWLPDHKGLWMLSLETFGGPSACHFYRISIDNKVLLDRCVGNDAWHQWLLPLAPGAHRIEVLATQFGTTEASYLRRATLTKVEVPCSIFNQYRSTSDEMTIFARPYRFAVVMLAPRRVSRGLKIPGVHGSLWLPPESIVPVGPFLVGSSGIERVFLGQGALLALQDVFVQVATFEPFRHEWRLGTRNWIPR